MGFAAYVHAVSPLFLFSFLFCLRFFSYSCRKFKNCVYNLFFFKTHSKWHSFILQVFWLCLFISPCAGKTDFIRCSPN